MSLRQDPSIMTAFLSYSQLGERSLDYGYFRGSGNLAVNPLEFLMQSMLSHRKLANDDEKRMKLLLEDTVNCAVEEEYDDSPYEFEDDDEENEEKEDPESKNREEHTYRHPSSSSSDVVESSEEQQRWDQVHTKIGKLLWAIDMVTPQGAQVCSLRPACSLQISVRIDEKNGCFYYDCFEHVPCFVDTDNSLPTKREVQLFSDTVHHEPTRQQNRWSDENDEDSADDDDAELDQPVQLRNPSDKKQRSNAHAQALAGKFFNSRLFRIKIPLDSIQGMLLRVTKKRAETAEDQTGVLIMELSQPCNDFAVRSVASAFPTCNRFRRLDDDNGDWTQDNVASKATRHYIYAAIAELQAFVTHLCHLDERMNAMMTPPQAKQPPKKKRAAKKGSDNDINKIVWGDGNSMGNSDVSYAKTPQAMNGEDKKVAAVTTTKNNLTTDQVEALFLKSFGTAATNDCLKAAVLRGHYNLDESITKNTVLYKGECFGCSKTLIMTWGDALDQPTCAGMDYEDGGESASIKCDDCGGNYLTSRHRRKLE